MHVPVHAHRRAASSHAKSAVAASSGGRACMQGSRGGERGTRPPDAPAQATARTLRSSPLSRDIRTARILACGRHARQAGKSESEMQSPTSSSAASSAPCSRCSHRRVCGFCTPSSRLHARARQHRLRQDPPPRRAPAQLCAKRV
eukprot:6172821-Pleurochrysis_carterae.AAC.1